MRDLRKGRELLQLLDRKRFDELCLKWGMDKGVRRLDTWEQTCAHIMAFVMRLESLREIEAALAIPRSTFADANSRRSAVFFEELCMVVLGQLQELTRCRKIKRAIQQLLALDASECRVHGSLAKVPKWLQKNNKQKNTASLKLHAVWNIDDEWIEDFRVTPGNATDTQIAKQFKIRGGCVYIFDRAYNDLSFWWDIVENGSHFVTRLKTSSKRNRKRELVLQRSGQADGVLWETRWTPSNPKRHQSVPRKVSFRHIIYRDPETKKVFDFITSDEASTAQEIADIYKKRWAVELLFRWLKGHLNIRYLASKNPNAIRIQMAVAILVQLLTQLYKTVTQYKGTLWDCLRQLRMSLVQNGLKGSRFPADLRWAARSTGALRPPPP